MSSRLFQETKQITIHYLWTKLTKHNVQLSLSFKCFYSIYSAATTTFHDDIISHKWIPRKKASPTKQFVAFADCKKTSRYSSNVCLSILPAVFHSLPCNLTNLVTSSSFTTCQLIAQEPERSGTKRFPAGSTSAVGVHCQQQTETNWSHYSWNIISAALFS